MTDEYNLSRRKALLGLGTIGVAGAGAGLGTSAYFSDEESFDGNSLTAGELDLYVYYDFSADQGGVESENFATDPANGIVQGDTVADGEEEVPISYVLDDVKPGDSGSLMFCPRIVDNPAWVWVGNDNGVIDYENGQTEPEAEEDETGGDPGEGEGELSEAIQVTVAYCNEDGETIREMNNPDDYTLADLGDDLEEGFLLDGVVEEDEEGGTDPYPGSEDEGDQQGPCICVDWEVPTEVGNEIQTDSVEFDLTFYAEQSRHNDEPENPFDDDNGDDS